MINIDYCVKSTTWTVGRIPALVILGEKEKQNKEKMRGTGGLGRDQSQPTVIRSLRGMVSERQCELIPIRSKQLHRTVYTKDIFLLWFLMKRGLGSFTAKLGLLLRTINL